MKNQSDCEGSVSNEWCKGVNGVEEKAIQLCGPSEEVSYNITEARHSSQGIWSKVCCQPEYTEVY